MNIDSIALQVRDLSMKDACRLIKREGLNIFEFCELINTLEEKWNEGMMLPGGEILALTPVKPLFGHRSG